MLSKLGIILALASFAAIGMDITVTKMSPDGELERSYVLSTQLPDKVVLDCQSFIQGLRIGEQESAVFFMLEPYDCEALQNRVKTSLDASEKHCIDVAEDIRDDYSC